MRCIFFWKYGYIKYDSCLPYTVNQINQIKNGLAPKYLNVCNSTVVEFRVEVVFVKQLQLSGVTGDSCRRSNLAHLQWVGLWNYRGSLLCSCFPPFSLSWSFLFINDPSAEAVCGVLWRERRSHQMAAGARPGLRHLLCGGRKLQGERKHHFYLVPIQD